MALSEKAGIVTGAGRGIGRATALALTAVGANVVAASRTARELEETVALTLGNRGACVAQLADVTRAEDLAALVSRCQAEFGRLDVLVNNAAACISGGIEEMTCAQFDRMMHVNVYSVFAACRAAWPALKESRGTIINLSSLSAFDPFPGLAAYGGTKAWVNAFTLGLANEGKPFGIKVFSIAPGAVWTEMLRGSFPEFPEEQSLQPDEVAAAIVWLLDDRSRYASGDVIRVAR